MTLVYSNRKHGHTLFIDMLDEETVLAIDDIFSSHLLEYKPNFFQQLVQDGTRGVLIAENYLDCRIPEYATIARVAVEHFGLARLSVLADHPQNTISFWRFFGNASDAIPGNITMNSANEANDEPCHICWIVCRRDAGVHGQSLEICPSVSENYWGYMLGLDFETEHMELPIMHGNIAMISGTLFHEFGPIQFVGNDSSEVHLISVCMKAY
jgi:hypothetical protein